MQGSVFSSIFEKARKKYEKNQQFVIQYDSKWQTKTFKRNPVSEAESETMIKINFREHYQLSEKVLSISES